MFYFELLHRDAKNRTKCQLKTAYDNLPKVIKRYVKEGIGVPDIASEVATETS